MSRLLRIGDRLAPWVGLALVLIAFWLLRAQSQRIKRDEHQGCLIQARGLPANKHLAQVMDDVQQLLALAPKSSKPLPPVVASLYEGFKEELAAYNKIEARQPAHRRC